MKDSALRRVRLSDYMIEQGISVDLKAQARLFSGILAGNLQALCIVTPAPIPIGATMASVLRHVIGTADAPGEVPVLTQARVVAELKKAALGRGANWTLLDRLILCVPTVDEASTPKSKDAEPVNTASPVGQARRPIFGEREKRILEVIEGLGINPMAIKAPTRQGCRDGDRRRIQRATPPEAMGVKGSAGSAFTKAFENTWSGMLKKGSIRLKQQSTTGP